MSTPDYMTARDELAWHPSEAEMKEYRDTFHPAVQPYLNYKDEILEKWKLGMPRYHGYFLEDITERGERGTGQEEMCWVMEGQDPDGYWVGMIVCRFCYSITSYCSSGSDANSHHEIGVNLSGFQVCPKEECRAEALLTNPRMVIDKNIAVESGHTMECSKSCCNPGQEDDDGA